MHIVKTTERAVVAAVFAHGADTEAEMAELDELLGVVKEEAADLVIVDADLSPTQLRNIGEVVQVRVVDRTQLILDIFAQRAHTKEGNLQVELAQLQYLLPRITSVYTRFERQAGGIGIGMRGPGETKLEQDRSRIRRNIRVLQD